MYCAGFGLKKIARNLNLHLNQSATIRKILIEEGIYHGQPLRNTGYTWRERSRRRLYRLTQRLRNIIRSKLKEDRKRLRNVTHKLKKSVANNEEFRRHRTALQTLAARIRRNSDPVAKANKLEWKRRRRARKLNLLSPEEPRKIARWQRDWLRKRKVHCYWCGDLFKAKLCVVDHIVPLKRGGLHCLANVCISCKRCNGEKHARDPSEFSESLKQPHLKLLTAGLCS